MLTKRAAKPHWDVIFPHRERKIRKHEVCKRECQADLASASQALSSSHSYHFIFSSSFFDGIKIKIHSVSSISSQFGWQFHVSWHRWRRFGVSLIMLKFLMYDETQAAALASWVKKHIFNPRKKKYSREAYLQCDSEARAYAMIKLFMSKLWKVPRWIMKNVWFNIKFSICASSTLVALPFRHSGLLMSRYVSCEGENCW